MRKKSYELTSQRAYEPEKITVLGFDREGKSTFAYLKRSPEFKNAEFWIVDKKSTIKIPRGAHASLGKNYLRNLSSFDLVFRTPGVPWMKPELVKARRAGVKFSSATKLFFEEAARRGVRIVGVTGTKGKGTTTTLLYKMLRGAGKKAFLAGNIGIPMLELLPKIKKNGLVILELSSFQLQDLETSPHTAVVLDIFPDHQDAHLNLREYYEAKTNIARHQKRGDCIFFFANHPLSRWVAQKSRGKKIPVGEKSFGLFGPGDLKMPGLHNFKNAVMAASVAGHLGVPKKTVIRIAKKFPGNEHRLEFIRKIRVHPRQRKKYPRASASIDFWNDSASTNPHTTAAAIAAFPNDKKILIAGGQDKGLDYAPLARAIKAARGKVPLVVLYGENAKKIARTIRRSKNKEVRIKVVKNLRRAVAAAYTFAKKTLHLNSKSLILFSPGAASFDQFKNYADRGERFKKIVRTLTD